MVIFLSIYFVIFILYGLLINYYRVSWNAVPEFDHRRTEGISISIVVAVRNEQRGITALLDALTTQAYSTTAYEIIIVDDHSTDRTADLVRNYSASHRNIIFIEASEGVHSKKSAIAAGIQASSGELVVTTDADCTMGPIWLANYAAFYTATGAKFIAAPVMIQPAPTLLGKFQSLDFMTMQGITGASVSRHFHNMCNGANLAYPRKVFEEVNGFAGIDNIPSGDDLFLMQKIYERYPTGVHYLKSRSSLVQTQPESSWKDFFNQRIRWASKATHFRDRRIFFALLLTYLVNAGFIVLAIASFSWINWFFMLMLFMLAKVLIEFPFVNAVAAYFDSGKQMIWFPFLQPLHILYILVAGWLGSFGSYQWKSRTVKT